MFSHVMVGADDMDAAKKFYDATFAAFGGPTAITDPLGRLIYMHNGSMFIVTKPINGEAACGANGGTIGFRMSPEQANAWHAAGVAAGGTACEDPPGPREGSPYYLAYLRDPAGNKLCALDVIA
ncbi:VOC family protein [Novosphingobium sp.]|uniref:VOC family protein n=1 Tax=Novosphingobium sp. TaxID=1874826 RepID=UPI0026192D8E|nr:VOC family protein [Novosphingobium sp.]